VLVQHGDGDELVDAGGDRRLGDAAQSRVHEHRLAHGQLIDERVELRTVAELALRLLERPRHAVARQVRVAGRRAQVAGQHLERRRLAGAVDTQQAETLALRACGTLLGSRNLRGKRNRRRGVLLRRTQRSAIVFR